ncbi:MAG: type III pantothenate kinase [Thermovirgaceae bacterium]|jgi:type III pantothenate kinase|nr:type III pantothenate kinase [Synergistales bacterium]MDI9393529.1 type III pantothenate kinase [Synergistota bacterium]HRW87532.1 type III pantothenate kinase [Thermovirgaceae bacterium]MDD3830318.1 type III pantothenate kinase [Synergistales bacterium]MDD5514983.1 type III pantothenate kinase [Synergistales bacterium]
MLLVVDIGNTNTVLGIFDGRELIRHWRLISERHTSDELGIYLLNLISLAGVTPAEISGAALCSVVPPLDAPWEEGIRRYLSVECLKVTNRTNIGIPVLYENPSEVGADRLVNAVAGIECFGSPLLVVDFGTAITIDAISTRGEYLGGSIAPGLVVSMEALFGKAARLPKVSFDLPEKVIGRNTRDSMQSGFLYGFAGMVDSLVERIREEMGEEVRAIATGGQAEAVAPVSRTISSVEPWLTLEGLRLIYEMDRGEN